MTQLSDELLVSYADGQMNAAQAQAVKAVLADDPQTAQRVAALEVTRAHLQAAFEAMIAPHHETAQATGEAYGDKDDHQASNAPQHGSHPPAPKETPASRSQLDEAELDHEFQALNEPTHRGTSQPTALQPSGASETATPPEEQTSLDDFEPNTSRAEPTAGDSEWGWEDTDWDEAIWDEAWQEDTTAAQNAGWGMTLTAGLLGIWLAGAVTGYFLYEFIAKKEIEAVPVRATKAPRQDLLTLVANAHNLFRKENLEISPESLGNRELMRFILTNFFGRQIPIPDLSRQGLRFTRAQILNLGLPPLTPAPGQRRPIGTVGQTAQIFYLSEESGAVALYIKPGTGKAAITKSQAGRTNVIGWTRGQLNFVLAGEMPHWKLIVLAAAIQRQLTPSNQAHSSLPSTATGTTTKETANQTVAKPAPAATLSASDAIKNKSEM